MSREKRNFTAALGFFQVDIYRTEKAGSQHPCDKPRWRIYCSVRITNVRQ